MALLPSGMGWSAEENYMKSLAGTIANISKLDSDVLSDLPITPTVADVVNNGVVIYTIVYNSARHPAEFRLIIGASQSGVKYAGINSESSTAYTSNCCAMSADSNAYLLFVRQRRDLPSGDWTTWNSGTVQINSAVSGHAGIYAAGSTNVSYAKNEYNAPVWLVPYYTSRVNMAEDVTVNNITINKISDGYCAIAFVNYKTYSNVISNTPVLISTVDDYTFFSNVHNETFTALYQGKRFYFSFSRDTDSARPNGILTLDYTGNSYPVMSPALLFEYVARSVSLTVTQAGDPWGDTPSEEGGGDGEPDSGDDVPFSTPPVASAVNSGFITLFTPDLLTIQGVASYMWNTLDVDLFKKIMGNPIDAIIGLHIVPCGTIPAGQKEIKVGGIGTGQTSGYTTTQYVQVSCGIVTIPKKWGSYLDYSPYTKVEIWLPYIGFREIDIDDVQGKTVGLNYWIDILSGACNAELYVPCDDGTNAVLYSWSGHCASEIPITSADMRGAVSAAMAIAGSTVAAVAGVASGGATAPMAAGLIASATVNSTALKPSIQRSGSASGSAGFLAQQTPYIIRSQPNIALPAEQYKFTGYPSFVTVSLNTISGYNEIDSIHLEGIPATGAEIDEIENLLKGGVIF